MKRRAKAVGCFLLALVLAFCLTGCDIPMPGFADYDVSGYIKALLDSSYHNSNDSFILLAQTTEEAARENHTTTVANTVVNFCNTYGVNPSDEQMAQLEEIFSQIFIQSRYTVREEQKVDTGYYIEVEVTPISNFSDCSAQLEALRQQAQQEADAANTPSPSPEPEDDEEDEWGEDDWGDEWGEDEDGDETPIATPMPAVKKVDSRELYMEKVVEFCRQQSTSVNFGVARTISLDIRQTSEGELQLDLNQIEKIDKTVLQLTVG